MENLSVNTINDIVNHHQIEIASHAKAGGGVKRFFAILTPMEETSKVSGQTILRLTYVVWLNGRTHFTSNDPVQAIGEYEKIRLGGL